MTNSSGEIVREETSLLSSQDDFLNFLESTDTLQKKLSAVKEVIDFRTDIFTQKYEKHQQYLSDQAVKLKLQEDEYIKKCKRLEKKMEEAKVQLMQIEYSYFDVKNKLDTEKAANTVLKDKINQMKLDADQQKNQFNKTKDLYLSVISRYEDYLNIAIDFDKENSKIFTITFKGYKKNFDCNPYITFKITGDKTFKVLKLYPAMKENTPDVLLGHHIVLFCNNFRENFLLMKSNAKLQFL